MSVSLESFMKIVAPMLKDTECKDVETRNPIEDESIREKLIDEIVDDLTYMADTLGIETVISLNDVYLTVYQEAYDKTTKLYFMFSEVKQATILSFADKCYVYRRGLFTDAFKKAKAEKDQKISAASSDKFRKQPGVIDSVIKIIKFKRSEE